MTSELSGWLRARRQACGWNVPEMARQLREAAKATGDRAVPGNKAVCSYIRRWERDQVAPSERYKLHYCKAFGITPAEFGQAPLQTKARSAGGRQGVQGGTAPAYAEVVRRIEFLALTGTTLVSLLAPPLVHGWPDRQCSPLPELDELLLAHLRAQNEGFRWLDRQHGAHELLPATAAHARNLTAFWRLTEPTNPLRCELAQIAADACHLVAYQAFDQGKRVQAIEWYHCSAELAAQADAQDLYVFAMCGVAYMHALNGDGELALSLLHQLAPLATSPPAQCYIAVYQAHGSASQPGYDDAFAALDRATALAERARDDVPSPWLGIPDVAFVLRQRAIIAAQLGSHEALGLLTLLDKQTPEVFQRYRITLLTDQALTHAQQGDVERSALLLEQAAQRNQHIRSVQKTGRILAVRAALDSAADSRPIKALDEVLHSTGLTIPPPKPLKGG
jgi:transcriptional regulator with XRE-family HTH domain